MLLALGVTAAQAGDNGVYIDQVGNQATVNITQTGTSNTFAGLNPALGPALANIKGDALFCSKNWKLVSQSGK